MYKHASQKYRPGSVASDTQVALSSKLPDPSTFTLQLSVPTPEDLEEVGALLAALATPPDVLFLDGGKYVIMIHDNVCNSYAQVNMTMTCSRVGDKQIWDAERQRWREDL